MFASPTTILQAYPLTRQETPNFFDKICENISLRVNVSDYTGIPV